ncbi:MAG: hypothetical protein J6E40_04790, partial [Lachnospiraceae bacterium]|nr:hypothetical protein [Lachnospiraceae bacterium]
RQKTFSIMKVTGTGRSSTWFKGNIFQADSRKRVFFYAVPEKHFLLIVSAPVDKLPQRSLCREVFMYVLLVSDDRKKRSAWDLGFGTEAFLS